MIQDVKAICEEIRTVRMPKCSHCQHYEICKYTGDYREILDKINDLGDLNSDIFNIAVDCKYYVAQREATITNIISNQKSYTLDGSIGASLNKNDIPKTLTNSSNIVDIKYGS